MMEMDNINQELFPCNVPLCPKTLKSKAAFENHILVEHGKKKQWSLDIPSTDFDFESASDKSDDDDDDFESESEAIPSYSSRAPGLENKEPVDKNQDPILPRKKIVSNTKSYREKLKVLPITITPALKSNQIKTSNPVKEESNNEKESLLPSIKSENSAEVTPKRIKREYTKHPQSDVKKVPRVPTILVRNKSDFSIEKIESLIKIKLSPEAECTFRKLIEEGKDQEIYSNMFGNIFWTAELPHGLKCRNWICKFCPNGKFLGSRDEFEAHFEAFGHGKLVYTCELCNKTQKKFELLKSHLKNKHFTDAKCDVCEQVFQTEGKMLMHKLTDHKIGGYQCDMCTKMCPSMQRLKIHVQENHTGQTFSCSTCMKVFKNKGLCVAHESTHSGKVYECEYCIDTFISEAGKAKHVKFQHTENFEKFTCEECGRAFNQKTSLNTHIKFHQRHPDLVCDVCGKLFHKRYAKVQHKKIVHENIRRFACDRCGFRTVSNGKLDHHIEKTHENKQEVCFLCNILVKHPYQHVRSAHSDKPTAWKEYMARKKAAMKLLKTRTKKEVLDDEEASSGVAFLDKSEKETEHTFIDRDQESLPSDYDIYPEQW